MVARLHSLKQRKRSGDFCSKNAMLKEDAKKKIRGFLQQERNVERGCKEKDQGIFTGIPDWCLVKSSQSLGRKEFLFIDSF